MTKAQEITLETLAGGGVVEALAVELDKVLADIQDPNKAPEAKRTITLKIVFAPDEERESVVIAVHPTSKLAPRQPFGVQAYLGRRNGKLVAVTFNPKQHEIFDEDQDASVHPISSSRSQEG